MINIELIPIIEEMLYDFMENKPEVVLIPSQDENCAKDGGKIRVATKSNPEWYRKMCADFPRQSQPSQPIEKSTKKRTIIKRKSVIKIFEHIIKNGTSRSKYAPYIIDEANRILEQYQDTITSKEVPF